MTIEQGFTYLRIGRLDQAKQIADQLIQIEPNNHGALNLTGLIAQQKGELEKAIIALEKAILLHQSEPIYHCNLGSFYYQIHRYLDAISACQNSLYLRSDYISALITLGSSYFAVEQYQEAEKAFKKAVNLNSTKGLYYAYWADSLRELGQINAAIETYEIALELSPELTYVLGNLGVTLLGIGQSERALEFCQQAAQDEPQNSNNWMNLGTIHRTLGSLEEAMEAYYNAYELDPRSAMLCTLIGQVWQEVSDLQQAILWFEKALEIEPDRIETRCALAEALLDQGDIETAIASFQDICNQHPKYSHAYFGLSKALWEDGKATEAVAIAQQAVALKPEAAYLKTHLATIMASAGDVNSANITNREALSVNPNCIPALVNLATNLRHQLPTENVQQMEHLLDANWVKDGAKASLHFGLAHYYDGSKSYAQASDHCLQANALYSAYKQVRGWNYKPEHYAHHIDQVIKHFTPDFFQKTQGMGHESIAPIFIVGMPRSGTTLTEQILASHPRVFGVGERNFGNRGFQGVPVSMGYPRDTTVWSVFDQISQPQISYLANWHLARLEELIANDSLDHTQFRHIVDKMPENYSLLGWLATLFPNAKIIHCRRNVCDIAVSCWMTQFRAIRWAFDLDHITERINQYWRIMDHWRQTLPIPMLEIDYEDTVADQASQTAKLLDFIGLEWNDRCLQFYKSDRLVRTASITQVRQPIYSRSVDRWRNYEHELKQLSKQAENRFATANMATVC
ncbi:MAG: sulfotransferase [Cyanobacteria bacterium P01_F01_bin.150]